MILSIRSAGKADLERGITIHSGKRAHGVIPACMGRQGRRPRGASHVRISCFNHGLPRSQAHPEMMQGTADVHHQSAETLLPQADPVFDHAIALHAAVDMLDPERAVVQGLIGHVLRQRQLLAVWLLGWHADLYLLWKMSRRGNVCSPRRSRGLAVPAPRRSGSGNPAQLVYHLEGEGKSCKGDRSFSEPTGNLLRSRSTTCLTPDPAISCCRSPRRVSAALTCIPGGATRRPTLSHRKGGLWDTKGPASSTN